MAGILTEKEGKLKKYISDYILHHGMSPTHRNMMVFAKLKSVSCISVRIDSMIEKGHLKRNKKNCARGITVIYGCETCPNCGK